MAGNGDKVSPNKLTVTVLWTLVEKTEKFNCFNNHVLEPLLIEWFSVSFIRRMQVLVVKKRE